MVASWSSFISFTASVDLVAPPCVALNSSSVLIYGNASSATSCGVIGFIPVSISSGSVDWFNTQDVTFTERPLREWASSPILI
jgi:hypothetical protein